MINTSFNHWKEKTNMAILVGGHTECDPLESYIISMIVISESFSDKKNNERKYYKNTATYK